MGVIRNLFHDEAIRSWFAHAWTRVTLCVRSGLDENIELQPKRKRLSLSLKNEDRFDSITRDEPQ